MPEKAAAIDGFVDALNSWVNSIRINRHNHARAETEKLKIFAQLLAENREFQAIYRMNLDKRSQGDPKEAMNCVFAFLNSVSDASRRGGIHSHDSDRQSKR